MSECYIIIHVTIGFDSNLPAQNLEACIISPGMFISFVTDYKEIATRAEKPASLLIFSKFAVIIAR